MIAFASPSASESLEIDDVIQGIVRLPMPAKDRVDLLRRLYDATEKVENGKCVLEGPLREELHRLFSQRHTEVTAQIDRRARLGRRNDRESLLLEKLPLTSEEGEELERIVAETRGDFDNLNTELEKFGRTLEKEIEADVSRSADAAGIADARAKLSETTVKKDDGPLAGSAEPQFTTTA